MANQPSQTLLGRTNLFPLFDKKICINSLRRVIANFDLQCSVDFLREKVRTRWQWGTGQGASRRQQHSAKSQAQGTLDPEVAAIHHHVEVLKTTHEEEEKKWHDELVLLFTVNNIPPTVALEPKSESPGTQQ